jgi:hypothetical protein
VIGALAAVGLAAAGNDGRVVQIGAFADDLASEQSIETLYARGVEVRLLDSDALVRNGTVDVGKHLRPSYRRRRIVQFATPRADRTRYLGVRLP